MDPTSRKEEIEMYRITQNRSYRFVGALGVVLALMLMAMPAVAKEKQEIIEAYKGNVMAVSGGAQGSSVGEFRVYRWSSDDERDEVLAAIKDATGKPAGKREVAKSLRGLDKAGYVFMSAQIGYPIRYTREFKMADGSRQIIMATDRPVSFQEAYTDSMAGDFDVTVIILKFDKDGKGEGIISIGTELVWKEDEQKIGVTNMSSQPVKVMDLRPVEK